ncbi:MAG: alpha/beta hydrolase [Phycisphaerae bacterium]
MCTGSLRRKFSFCTLVVGVVVTGGAILLTSGCADFLALALVRAPNQTWSPEAVPPTPTGVLNALGVARELRIEVGPPDASLSVWIVDPSKPARAQSREPLGSVEPLGSAEPRGTILVLHGLYSRKEMMLGIGKDLAAAGYRAVLVDFRGQGLSSGEWLTFGAVETNDLTQVLDHLDEQGMLVGPVGVYGTSYGGGVGIQFAGADARVKAVVAIAPFQSLDEVYPPLVRPEWPLAKVFLSDALLGEALERAAEFAEFDRSQADALGAMSQTSAHVMLVHGKLDTVVPYEQSVALAAAGGDRAKLVTLDWADHTTIMVYQHGALMGETLAWFEKWMRE